MEIRKAAPEDAFEFASCHIASWRSAYQGIVPDEYLNRLTAEKWAERFQKNLKEQKEYSYLCAVHENQIAGILILGKSRDEDKPLAGEICAIYLKEEFWSKGLGGEMMAYALKSFKNENLCEAILWVLEENGRARRFYEKYGFVSDGVKKEITLGKPLTEIRYVLAF